MSKQNNRSIRKGAAILILIFGSLFFVLAGRFFYIEVTGKANGQLLASRAEKAHTHKSTIEAHRGTIYDRKGTAVAEDTTAYTVIAILDKDYEDHVKDPEKTAEKLAPLLDMKEEKLLSLLTRKGAFQVELGPGGRNINHELRAKIEKLNLPGIGFKESSKRFYPNGEFASHIIGYAQKNDKGETVGMMGIEKQFNDALTEKDGYMTYESDSTGLKLPNPKESIVAPKQGKDVYLTIDQKIQVFLEESMSEVQKEYEPSSIIGIVANPKTGEILAMSNRPGFNPNQRNIQNFGNSAISSRFEPGSTMKIFTLSAAVDAGVYNGDELYKSGSYKVGGSKIGDHNNGVGWGPITYNEGVQRSSNVAFAKLAMEKIGPDRLMEYFKKFGLDKKTGINIPGEVGSKFVYNKPLEQVTTAFGQGSAITAIQQIQAVTAVANDGKMMKPYVVKKVVDSQKDKVISETKPEVVSKPISAESAKEVRKLLRTVVTGEHGTGAAYDIDGYEVAGKTGTAQIAGEDGKYLTGRENYTFSFMGMAPADDPELVMYVAVKQPHLKAYETGGKPVAEVFNPTMQKSLQYLQVKPSEEEKEKTKSSETKYGNTLDSYVGSSVEEAKKELTGKGLSPVIIGNGETIAEQQPAPGSRIIYGNKVFLQTDGSPTMPDLTGFSYRDVLEISELLNLKTAISGHGYVAKGSQSIKKGASLENKSLLSVELHSAKKAAEEKREDSDEEQEESSDSNAPLD
ncbi:penicillin-binding protein [Priestia filamentosa]|uniref:serine-type D-Ala-D-Ala carboxypeptidase n=1 Tax=Priestia filamentosa TaxID=1402861 RepID=A0A1X7D491_9BACI|nr:penicillin-binding protein [Priestia filamentosa]AKO93928.1 penicillin-binding protein [Priestia filamentosa]MDT3764171.1 penicillin-binding protein [Priestia filamentosa]OXS71358.1 penicillin-binding protein [Priestia filamentosa]WCM14801.1 penicillin-binding protein [Priestia filamentosa]WRU94558.1 penicillin-binding protein [Priestia filamentosa]